MLGRSPTQVMMKSIAFAPGFCFDGLLSNCRYIADV
jgi:hypothetical protein